MTNASARMQPGRKIDALSAAGDFQERLTHKISDSPWSDDKANRLNPSNGLCLSAIHDKAFDSYLFSLTDDHRVVLSKALEHTKDAFLREVFWPTRERQIALPERFQPMPAFVRQHRERMHAKERHSCA
jgi:hypothetical protein